MKVDITWYVMTEKSIITVEHENIYKFKSSRIIGSVGFFGGELPILIRILYEQN